MDAQPTPEEMHETLSRVAERLSAALLKGWQRFQQSDNRQLLDDYLQFLLGVGFYQSAFHNLFPNPAYDAAAKDLGKEFLVEAAEFGLSFDSTFPGDFAESRESPSEQHQARGFFLRTFCEGERICTFVIRFTHSHDKLDFSEAPQLLLVPEPFE